MPDPEPFSTSEPNDSNDALFLRQSFLRQVVWKAEDDVYQNSASESWNPYVLPLALRTVWAVTQAQEKIMNGNVQRFFENDWPEQPPYSLFVDAFKAIEANEAADCLRDAVEAFGFSNPHVDRLERRRVMDGVDADGKPSHANEVIDQLGRRLMRLETSTVACVARFVFRNREFFPMASAHIKAHPEQSLS